MLEKSHRLQTHWLKLKLVVWEFSILILSAKSLSYALFLAVLFLLSFDSFFSATVLVKKGGSSRCLKLHIPNQTSGLWQNHLKKKKITNTLNTFFVRSSSGSMLAKSHQKVLDEKAVMFASCPKRATIQRRNNWQKPKKNKNVSNCKY